MNKKNSSKKSIHLRKKWWYFIAALNLLGWWILYLIVPFFVLGFNIVLNRIITTTTFMEIITNFETINSILIIDVALLTNLLFLIASKNYKSETSTKIIYLISLFAFGCTVILTIQKKHSILSIDSQVLFWAMLVITFFTLICVIVKSENQNKISDYVEKQEQAYYSRSIKTVKINDKDIEL